MTDESRREGITMKKTNVQRKSGDTDAEKEQAAAKVQKEDADRSPTKPWVSGTMTKVTEVAYPVAVGVGAKVATQAVIGALGFGTTGIAAGSLAAKAMSLAATSGHGMSVVSALQSVGAAGLSTTQEGITMEMANSRRDSGDTDSERVQAATIIQKCYQRFRVSGTTMTRAIRAAVPVAVGVGAVVATPVVIGGLGFKAAGIAAGSVAAKGMSLAATSGSGSAKRITSGCGGWYDDCCNRCCRQISRVAVEEVEDSRSRQKHEEEVRDAALFTF
ncbi:hypothetical protein C0Q70_14821 [Pomacea canaliculata]|uniref:Uncharacterized protein n=1 Tax=Pomacea canaliculata TaxID=400727 RepID=A0A2T7NT36_POMCA|nr:hypothetical protein C0Q70_14821 [Pomacea canaliculata]